MSADDLFCLVIHKRVDFILIKIFYEISITSVRHCNVGKKQAVEKMWTDLFF